MEQKFYICKHCGNIIAKVKDAGVPVVCCGEPMSEIVPGTTDAAVEKHVPVWTVENGIVHVKVGSVEHPMLPEHYIEWVSLQTKQGNQRKELHPGEKPEVCFALCEGDEVEAVYAYCNLHGRLYYCRPVCWFFRTCSCRCMCSIDQCVHLCGTGSRCACEPLFRSQGVWQNENNRVNLLD